MFRLSCWPMDGSIWLTISTQFGLLHCSSSELIGILPITKIFAFFFRNEEAWIGLTNTIYGYNWIDCVSLDFDKFALFKDENSLEFKSSEQCYRVKEGENFRWRRKKCGDKLAAICEQRILGIDLFALLFQKFQFSKQNR